MAYSLADFSVFFQDEGKSIKRGENRHKSGHVESCSYLKVELVGSIRGGKCYDVSYTTGVVLFIITYFHKLIYRLFDNKHGLSSHEKLSFKLTNIICVIQGTSQTGSKYNFPCPIDCCSDFLLTQVPWGPPEGA